MYSTLILTHKSYHKLPIYVTLYVFRYLSTDESYVKHHAALAELYDQETGIKRSITLVQRKGKVSCMQTTTQTIHMTVIQWN